MSVQIGGLPDATGAGPSPLIAAGEVFRHSVRYSSDDIAAFARLTLDSNPLHFDEHVAQRARFGGVIASGQQTAAKMMGIVASHFSRSDDGVKREMLCLNFNFSFKAPVFADQDVQIVWTVGVVTRNGKLGGWLGHLDGHARVPGGHIAVISRGTVLVKPGAA